MLSAHQPQQRSRCTLGDLTLNNINQLRLLNDVLFAVKYNDHFYEEALASSNLTKLALFNDITVGGVCCRMAESVGDGEKHKIVYILTLGVLKPYRRLGLGRRMVSHVIQECRSLAEVRSIQLHVQTDNEEARLFYKSMGFTLKETVPDYYKHSPIQSAWLFQYDLAISNDS